MQLLSSLILSAVVSQAAVTNTPDAPAHPVSEPIRLDGVLDEPVWASVPTIGRLLQQEPNPESDPTEETEVNPVGARADGQVSNNAERRTLEWDGIWDAAARITEDGWVAEVEIPFKTLRFKPGQTTWGFNVERTIRRLNESHILGFQSRFRWILKPGNDLFVVFNRGWEDIDNRFRSAFDHGTVKFQYTFRL